MKEENIEESGYLTVFSRLSYEAIVAWNRELKEIGLGQLSRHQAKHLSLTFPQYVVSEKTDADVERAFRHMMEAVQAVTAKLASLAGIPLGRIASTGLLLLEPHPHCHLIVVSQKDRVSGRSIKDLTSTKVEELLRWWQEKEGNTAAISAAWGLNGLLGYISSMENALRPNQKWKALPVTNPSIVKRIVNRKEKRECPRCQP